MTARILTGDCLAVLPTLEADSADAVVSDPPYGLHFMGKSWDQFTAVRGINRERGDTRRAASCSAGKYDDRRDNEFQAFMQSVSVELLRVAKPGAYMVMFGAPRRYHRLACGIEDAGWELQDCLMWLFGSGFPKHKSKLKPGYEPIVLARKSAPRATPLQIDACRIGLAEGEAVPRTVQTPSKSAGSLYGADQRTRVEFVGDAAGRWPANVVLGCACESEQHETGCAVAMLDEQSGVSRSRIGKPRTSKSPGDGWGMTASGAEYDDAGGASRFFYTAKASRAEREAGCEHLAPKAGGSNAKGFTDDVAAGQDRNKPVHNFHPTVKPIALMRWLVRLVTPPGGTVLDPFAGSGTTGSAAAREGRSFVGIEMHEEYAAIATARLVEGVGPLFVGEVT